MNAKDKVTNVYYHYNKVRDLYRVAQHVSDLG